jgi:hypothetical protein
MLNWLRWGAASIALLSLVAMASLVVAYAWHSRLKPKLTRRRARQRVFEHLLAHTSLDNHSPVSEPSNARER